MSGSSLIIGLVLAIAAAILLLCLGIGVFGYKPERAQRIRDGEAAEPVVVEEIRRIHISAPDRFRRSRIDRHWWYVLPNFGILGYSLCLLAGAPVTSNIASLDQGTRFTMAVCFLIGSVCVLTGSVMGSHLWRWDIVPGVSEHIAAPRLGDDIRLPYMFGVLGMFAIGVSTAIYSTTSFSSTLGSLGGWLTSSIATACALMGWEYIKRIRQYSRTLKVVVSEAVANVIARGEDDAGLG